MEVKIGVLHTPREIVLETTLTPEEVESTVSAALKSVDGALSLTDERGRKVIVPANLVAYVEIAQADVTFDHGLLLDLGGVRVHARHVGGAHAADSSVMFVERDDLLFLGDALCDAVDERLEREILSFEAQRYVEGHHPAVSTRVEIEAIIAEQRDLH